MTTLSDARREDVVELSRTSSTTLGEANSDGFSTTVLPAASVGPIFCARVMIGEFQGIIAPIAPSGSRDE